MDELVGLVLGRVGVSPKVVTESLEKVVRQPFATVAVVVGDGGGKGRHWYTSLNRFYHHSSQLVLVGEGVDKLGGLVGWFSWVVWLGGLVGWFSWVVWLGG